MRNRKGEIATLLTLGLVVVGSLITLGTSLFVSSKKTNLSSNSRAAGCVNTPIQVTCPNGRVIWKQANGTFWANSNCSGDSGYTNLCGSGGGSTPVPTQGGGSGTQCPYDDKSEADDDCRYDGGATKSGCGTTAQGKQTYKCVNYGGGGGSPTVAPTQGADDGEVPFPDKACCFYKNGKATVYAKASARVANQMTAPCTTAVYGNAYGATSWGYCNDDGSGYGDGSENICEKSTDSLYTFNCISKNESCENNFGKGTLNSSLSCGNTNKKCCKKPKNSKTPTPKPNCVKHLNFNCKTVGGADKKINYYKSDSTNCVGNLVERNCYGSSASSCSQTWSSFIKQTSTCAAVNITPNPTITGIPNTPKPGQPTATTSPVPTFASDGSCTASGTRISYDTCSYFESTGTQNCSNTTPIYNSNGCIIFRLCRIGDCQYDCYKNNNKFNCLGAQDPNNWYDYVRIINNSSKDIVIGKIMIEKMQAGGNPVRDVGGVTLKPGGVKAINLNSLGETFACSSISLNSIRVVLLNAKGVQIGQGQDGCGGGVKILINLK